jgi:hypothetical protein
MKTKKESANPVVRNKYTAQFCNGLIKPDTSKDRFIMSTEVTNERTN